VSSNKCVKDYETFDKCSTTILHGLVDKFASMKLKEMLPVTNKVGAVKNSQKNKGKKQKIVVHISKKSAKINGKTESDLESKASAEKTGMIVLSSLKTQLNVFLFLPLS